MTDSPTPMDEQQAGDVTGGGPATADPMAPVRAVAERLELLSPETRDQVLAKMDPAIADRIREYMASQPDNRPHGQFSNDVATRKQLIHEMANRHQARQTETADRMVEELANVPAMAQPAMPGQPPMPPAQSGMMGGAAAGAAPPSGDPLEQLRDLHPAAIARAMQGERAEAWAIVLDRLDSNAKAALQLYLDGTARMAIEDARVRQQELAASSPALLATVVAAIARTVVPRAMREHHQLLSTTPMTWTGLPA